MRYRVAGPSAGVSVTTGGWNLLHSFVVPTNRLMGIELIKLSTNQRDLALADMPVRVQQYDTEGTTGTVNSPVAVNPLVTAGLPTGKHGWTLSGTNMPNANPVTLWSDKMHPSEVVPFDLVSRLNGVGLYIPGAKCVVVEVTPPVNCVVYLDELVGFDW